VSAGLVVAEIDGGVVPIAVQPVVLPASKFGLVQRLVRVPDGMS
jgi:hypothetical protein